MVKELRDLICLAGCLLHSRATSPLYPQPLLHLKKKKKRMYFLLRQKRARLRKFLCLSQWVTNKMLETKSSVGSEGVMSLQSGGPIFCVLDISLLRTKISSHIPMTKIPSNSESTRLWLSTQFRWLVFCCCPLYPIPFLSVFCATFRENVLSMFSVWFWTCI